ncbi:HD domain-containing phosphohydrolase, partial [Pseudomonas aeruginosa]
DGSGYPDGLAGTAIPLAARLMAVADVYDALISVRPYKQAMSHEEALAFIRAGSGSHFDPRVVEALDACLAEVRAIASR